MMEMASMEKRFPLTCQQMSPFFPSAQGRRVDDRRVIGGIIDVIRHGLPCQDALKGDFCT